MPEQEKPKDDLTGLALRKDLYSFVEEVIKEAAGGKKTFALVLLDIDRFKKFNDKFGHPFGDEVLKYMASTLRLSFEKNTYHLFRYGGDEFIIVLPDKSPRETLQLISHFKYIMRHRPFIFGRRIIKITTSSGVAVFPSDGNTMDGLIEKADDAMYFSKRHARNITTLAARVKPLKVLEKFLVVLFIFFISLDLFMLREFIFKKAIPATKETIDALSASLSPINSDRVILKNGAVFNGKITKETNKTLILSIYTEKGIMTTLNLEKSEIKKIQYGLVTPSRERYRDYMKDNPNPHKDY